MVIFKVIKLVLILYSKVAVFILEFLNSK